MGFMTFLPFVLAAKGASLTQTGMALTLTFSTDAGQPMTRVELLAGTTGGFAGKLSRAGAVRTVSLRR